MTMEVPFISVVIPVKNEAGILKRCLDSLKNMEYPPERFEIIIADGMSKDDTIGVALGCGAQVVSNERELVASGRNRGFEAAKGEMIAFTDADCVFDRKWLANSLKYFEDDKVGGVGGATLQPKDSSYFEKAIDFIFNAADFFKSTAHRRRALRVEDVTDIPGCNAIYRKSALKAVMPVDDNLLTAEDVWMNFQIRKRGYRLVFAPDVILWHYRRNSPKMFLRQVYRFAVGRAQVAKKCPELLGAIHAITSLAIPVFLLSVIYFYLTEGGHPFFWAVMAFSIIIVSLLSFLKTRSIRVAVNVPIALAIFCLGWSYGFLKEMLFPIKNAKGK